MSRRSSSNRIGAGASERDDSRRAATRARVIEEATRLFSHYGFRRTSVDTIAAAAQVAKPTLYAYFPDKEAVFVAVVETTLDRVVTGARDAASSTGSLADRLTAMLAAKFTFLFDLVESSPHATELLGSSNRLGADRVEDTDKKLAALLRQVIEAADRDGEIDLDAAGVSARKLADALMRCGHGASFRATGPDDHRKHLAELVGLVIAGVRRTPRR